MPTHVRVECILFTETGAPRDVVTNNPCFRWDNLLPQDAESLANNVMDTYDVLNGGPLPWHLEAKVYDLEGSPPILPMAHVVRNQGVYADADDPREVALCLSFYGGQHQPRQRGRLYVPVYFIRPLGKRPGLLTQQKVVNWGKALANVGGENVQWIVWSRRNKSATGVSHAWCNDEYDTVRRRGLRETHRELSQVP